MTQPSGDGEAGIVVGVDGSASSKAALAWAVKQARLTGAEVGAMGRSTGDAVGSHGRP